MYFLLAKHIRNDDWEVAIAEIPTLFEANAAMAYEISQDFIEKNWEYLVVKAHIEND